MKALLAKVRCAKDGKKKTYDVALGKDGNVYPLHDDLTDLLEAWEASKALGFDPKEMFREDCFSRLRDVMNFPVTRVICQKNVLPLSLLGYIAYEWTQVYPQMMDPYKNAQRPCDTVPYHMYVVWQSLTHPGQIRRSMLVRAKQDIDECMNRKKLVKSLGHYGFRHLFAMSKMAQMALEVWDDKLEGYQTARIVAAQMATSLAQRPEYRGLSERHVREAARKSQLVSALDIVNKYDAWTTELELG